MASSSSVEKRRSEEMGGHGGDLSSAERRNGGGVTRRSSRIGQERRCGHGVDCNTLKIQLRENDIQEREIHSNSIATKFREGIIIKFKIYQERLDLGLLAHCAKAHVGWP